jgi:hypothetical protein
MGTVAGITWINVRAIKRQRVIKDSNAKTLKPRTISRYDTLFNQHRRKQNVSK